MSRRATKTDNSFFETKVKLRIDHLPGGKTLDVLDCFAGTGCIWRRVQDIVQNRKFCILSIDRKADPRRLALTGDNVKFLASMDLRRFDVIDLVAYGSPFEQLKLILAKPLKPTAVIFGTFIQSVMGGLPNLFLADLGYSPGMVRKIPTVFYRHGRAKLLAWLGNHGIKTLNIYTTPDGRKNYFSFSLP